MVIGIDASRGFVEQPTGTERYSYELITRILEMPEANIHTWILYLRNTSPPAPLLTLVEGRSNIFIVSISMSKLWTQIGLAYRTWVDKLDVLWVPAHTLPVLRRPGVKTVVTIHGIEYEWLPAYENTLQRWYLPLSTQYAVKTANKIIAVSKFTGEQIVQRLGGDPKKISVVHEGYAISQDLTLNPSPNSGEGHNVEVLKKFGLQKGKYILFVGTVQPRKNLERLVEAYLTLYPSPYQGEGPKLVIAGKMGWGYEALLRKCQMINDKCQIVFTGYISEAERYSLLRYAMVYVQPSITEGFGLPVLEAWAAGLAVASSRGGALEEILRINTPSVLRTSPPYQGGEQEGVFAGVLFDPLSVEDMAEKLGLLIKDKRLRQEMARRGRLRVKDFSWDKAAQETFNLIVTS